MLDVVRASAILMVILHHTAQMSNWGTAGHYTKAGALGVDLFFVLSGFLVGRLFLAEAEAPGQFRVWNFWLRRAIRTFPPYFVVLAVTSALLVIQRHEKLVASYLWFGQNYLNEIPYFLVSWSLCVEEHFYVLLPLLGYLPRHWIRPCVPLFFLSAIVISLSMRMVHATDHNALFGYFQTATHLRLDGLAMGFAVAYAADRWPRIPDRLAHFLPASACLALFSVLSSAWWSDTAGYVWLHAFTASVFAILVLAAAGSRSGAPAWLRFLGASAYSLYLTHSQVIHGVLITGIGRYGTLALWTSMVVAIFAVGILFYYLVERPSIQIRDHFVARAKAQRQ